MKNNQEDRKFKEIFYRIKKATLNQRLAFLVGTVMLPLVILVIYLTVSFINSGNEYNQIVKSITMASTYNSNFREDINYSVYRIVINNRTYDMIQEEQEKGTRYKWDNVEDPYKIIHDARVGFEKLAKITTEKENKERIDWILTSLNRLEMNIEQIEDNITFSKPAKLNSDLLETAVYILTEDIQEEIQEYVYNQAMNFEVIRADLENQQRRELWIGMVALTIIILFSISISRSITRSVTKPIQELCKATEEVAKGDFETTTHIESGDEIQVLTKSFNNMKGEIGQLIDDMKHEQLNLRATELKLLQAQINPHFLYNTLDTIVWLAEGNQTKRVVEMVTSLSEFFRTVLSEGKDFITIREETSHIRSYLSIQQFRYQDILAYEIDIDEILYEYEILKLTIQPLVENALYHGIKWKRGGGKITVKGFLSNEGENEEVKIQVIDNGKGMTAGELRNLRKKIKGIKKNKHEVERGGFGLANVNERIRMNYGEAYGITFESVEGEGTTATVNIPLRRVGNS
jgi:two-component system sensor histidine kinase YesM